MITYIYNLYEHGTIMSKSEGKFDNHIYINDWNAPT